MYIGNGYAACNDTYTKMDIIIYNIIILQFYNFKKYIDLHFWDNNHIYLYFTIKIK